jgi:N6-adenosine-specific RNA methylase IME4
MLDCLLVVRNISIQIKKEMKYLFLKEGTKYSFIVLDPPWTNKSVRRKRPYNWSDFDDIQSLPVEHLIDRTSSSLICCWSTNCDRIEEFIKNDLFKKWNCQYLTTWYWLKVCLIKIKSVICVYR